MKSNKKDRRVDTSTPITFATAEQLTKINSLEISIKLMARQLNSPYTTIISALFFPVIAEILILNSLSPFNLLYKKLYLSYYDHFSSISNHISTTIFSIRKKQISTPIEQVINSLTIARRVRDFNPENDPELPLQIIMQRIESLYSSKSETVHILKRNLMTAYNHILIDFKENLLIEENLEEYPIEKLYRSTIDAFNHWKKITPLISKAVLESFSEYESHVAMDKWMLLGKFMITVASKYFIVDPLFNRLYPSGIFQVPIPATIHNWQSKYEANQHISLLERQRTLVLNKANRNINSARILSALLLMFSIRYLIQGENPSIHFIILAVSCIGTAITNLTSDIKNYYDRSTLQSTLAQKNQLISYIFTDFNGYELNTINNDSLESSYFTLFIRNKHFAKVIKNCFVIHGIKIISHYDKLLTISASTKLDITQVTAIKLLLVQSIERIKSMKELKAQLQTLAEMTNCKYLFLPTFDRSHLPYIDTEFELSLEYKNLFMAEFVQMFQGNHIQFQSFENTLVMSLQGFTPTNINSLKCFENKILLLNTAKHKEHSSLTVMSSDAGPTLNLKKEYQRTEKESDEERSIATVIPMEKTTRFIRWSACTYDSSKSTACVHPLNTTGVYNNKFLETTRRFTKNELSIKSFPNEELFVALCRLIEIGPHTVPPKGHSGLVFSSGYARDQNDNWFKYAMKAKLLGRTEGKGDVRAYAEAEMSETGETVYKFKGVIFHSH